MGRAAYQGHFPKRDNAAVWALREAGAVILGKTVTAGTGGSQPGLTRHPFDLERTPGGSSSGLGGCGGSAHATDGHRHPGRRIYHPSRWLLWQRRAETDAGCSQPGERQATQYEHAWRACLAAFQDTWQVAIEIARRAGGDRGCLGLFGPRNLLLPCSPHA